MHSYTELGKTEISLVKDAHRISHTPGPRQKPQFHTSLGPTSLGKSPGEVVVAVTHFGKQTLVVDMSGSIHLCELFWRLTSWYQYLALPKSL